MRRPLLVRRAAIVTIAAAVAWSAVVFYSMARHRHAQYGIKHVWSGPSHPTEFPVVVSHRIRDRYGGDRIVMLHKLTRPPSAELRNPFRWVDLIALNPADGRLECRVGGREVTVAPDQLQVFYAVDGSSPKRLIMPAQKLSPLDSPATLWERLVEE